jgi:hypothetical protein
VDKPDYYQILQVESSASQEQIRAAFKRLALIYHPDRSKDPDSTEQMRQLNEAYEFLGTPEKRALYDTERQNKLSIIIFDESPEEDHASPRIITRFCHLAMLISGWVSNPLKTLFRVTALVFLIFLWALIVGQIDFVAMLILILFALWIILSLIIRLNFANIDE